MIEHAVVEQYLVEWNTQLWNCISLSGIHICGTGSLSINKENAEHFERQIIE